MTGILTLFAVAALIVACVAHYHRTRLVAANALPPPIVPQDVINLTATSAISTRYLLVKRDTDKDYVVVNTAGVYPTGTCLDEPAAGEVCAVDRWMNGKCKRVVNDGSTVAVDALIYAAAGGKCGTTSSSAKLIGRAVTTAAADGDVFIIEPILTLA